MTDMMAMMTTLVMLVRHIHVPDLRSVDIHVCIRGVCHPATDERS